ncbi:MAG: hypothetical protein FD131_4978 [Rhodocyclaceae bacterium]|nr:MAG: hypothetical protein FD131_4978 [Rhodocyclaceae bacterium]
MNMFDATQCFVSLARMTMIDVCRPDGTSWINGATLEEIKVRYPDVKVMSVDEATEELERVRLEATGAPCAITREQFLEAFNCLPPREWHNDGDSESFKSSEALSGRITSVCVRIGEDYFSLHALFGTPHRNLVGQCRAARQSA